MRDVFISLGISSFLVYSLLFFNFHKIKNPLINTNYLSYLVTLRISPMSKPEQPSPKVNQPAYNPYIKNFFTPFPQSPKSKKLNAKDKNNNLSSRDHPKAFSSPSKSKLTHQVSSPSTKLEHQRQLK